MRTGSGSPDPSDGRSQPLRVVSNTSSMLVLAHTPRIVPAIAAALVIGVIIQTVGAAAKLGLGEWIAATMGILVGSFVTYLSALRSRIEFDANSGEVRWQHFGWPGRARGSCPLTEVTGVEVLGDPSSVAERLALATTAGVVPLTRHFSGIEPHERNAAVVREWLSRYAPPTPAG